MTTIPTTTIAARVPEDLRTDLEAIAAQDGVELSHVMRGALRAFADHALGRAPEGDGGLFAPQAGTTRRHDRSTSTKAAADVAPRTGSQRRRALEVIVDAGADGATTDEVIVTLTRVAKRLGQAEPAVNGVARRVTDLVEVGAVETTMIVGTSTEATRKTRHGSDALVWVATAKGRAWLGQS